MLLAHLKSRGYHPFQIKQTFTLLVQKYSLVKIFVSYSCSLPFVLHQN